GAKLEGELEVGAILRRQRGDRDGDAWQVHPFARADLTAHEHRAPRTAVLDLLDPQMHVAVVDQNVVPRLEHLAEHGRPDGDLAVARSGSGSDTSRLAAGVP